jgi:hypothetical protein
MGLRGGTGGMTPLTAVYPLGFWQIAKVMLKANLVRTTVIVAVVAILTPLVAMALHRSVAPALPWILKGVFVIYAIQPFFVVTAFSPGTNDTSRFRLAFLWLAFAAAVVVSGILFFFASVPAGWVLAGMATAGSCFVAFLAYGKAYNENWFDAQAKLDPKKAATG